MTVGALTGFFLAPLAVRFGTVFPDSSVYLDVGRELFRSGQFATKINLVALWPTREAFPALAYYNPLFSFLAGLFYSLTDSLATTIIILVVMAAAFNALLLFSISRRLFNDRVAWLSMLIFLLSPLLLVNVTILNTEQLGITCALLTVWLLVSAASRPWSFFLAGVTMALGFLIQVSSLFNSFTIGLAFVIWRGLNRRTVKDCLFLLGGLLLIVGFYQALCLHQTGMLYPIYPNGAKVWSQSIYFGPTRYVDSWPALRAPKIEFPYQLLLAWSTEARKINQYASCFWKTYLCFSLMMPWAAFFYSVRRRRSPILLLTIPALANLIIFINIYYWLPAIEVGRYAIMPAALLIPPTTALIISFLRRMKTKWPWNTLSRTLWVSLAAILIIHYAAHLLFKPGYFRASQAKRAAAVETIQWLKDHTTPEDPVALEPASDLMEICFYLDRYVAPLPYGRAASPSNFKQFIKLYCPKYAVIETGAFKDTIPYRGLTPAFLADTGCRSTRIIKQYEVFLCNDSCHR